MLDLETTGGNRNDDMITEIGVVKVRGGECLGTFQTLVNPGRAIPPQITRAHRAHRCRRRHRAAHREPCSARSLDFVGGGVFVGHNVVVRPRLPAGGARPRSAAPTTARPSSTRPRSPAGCVRDEVPDCRLGTLADRLRLDHKPTHRALDDALATTDLLHHLHRAGDRARRARARRPGRRSPSWPGIRRPPSSR